MKITFPINGKERVIKWDGRQFMPIVFKSENSTAINFCSSIGRAVLTIIKEEARSNDGLAESEEVVELKELVNRFDKLFAEISKTTLEHIPLAVVEHKEKKSSFKKNNEDLSNQEDEEDEF